MVTEERVCVQLVVRRRVLELDLIQSDLELFRQQHWHRGVRALSHFDLAHDQGHAAIPADANEGVRREGGRCSFGRRYQDAGPRLVMPSEQQSTAGGSARGEEIPTGDAPHGQPSFLAVTGFRAACLMASRMRGYVPQRQMFPDIAWSISASVGARIFASSAAAAMICPDWQ